MNRYIRCCVFAGVAACLGCAGTKAPDKEPIPIAVSRGSVTRMERGRDALLRFKPAREPDLTGGECLPVRELSTLGTRTIVARFPTRRDPETSIALTVDSSGRVVRYTEERGVPRPAATIEESQAQNDRMVRTHVQLDYVTGEALVINAVPGTVDIGVMGSVADFENTPTLGNLRDRVESVRRLCKQ